ncbi:MAG: hypothetical protein ACYDB9_12240 [Gammaproteobacteria bacterium]
MSGIYCAEYSPLEAWQPAHPNWYAYLVPGAYLDVGRNVRAEFTLVRSPWTGHHLVAYLQLLFRLQ